MIGAVNLICCRLQTAQIGPYRIFNCYAPSGSENRFARVQFYGEELFRYFKLHPDSSKIIGGDHNCVLRKDDVENGVGFASKFCGALQSLVQCEHLVDCHLLFPRQSKEFTFHRPGKAKSRLDRFYVSDFISQDVIVSEHIPSLSDHLGVKLVLTMEINKT